METKPFFTIVGSLHEKYHALLDNGVGPFYPLKSSSPLLQALTFDNNFNWYKKNQKKIKIIIVKRTFMLNVISNIIGSNFILFLKSHSKSLQNYTAYQKRSFSELPKNADIKLTCCIVKIDKLLLIDMHYTW